MIAMGDECAVGGVEFAEEVDGGDSFSSARVEFMARSGQKEGANCAVAAVPVSECCRRIESNLSAVLCDGWIEMALLE